MEKRYESSIIKNHNITKNIFDGVPSKRLRSLLS